MISVEIDDIGVEFRDAGPWRCYTLESEGDSLDALIINAFIFEIDQDGGELNSYSLSDAENNVYKEAVKALEYEWENINSANEEDFPLFNK